MDQYWKVVLRGPDDTRFPPRLIRADLDDPDTFRAHLLAIARRVAPADTDEGEEWISGWELEVYPADDDPDFDDPTTTLHWVP